MSVSTQKQSQAFKEARNVAEIRAIFEIKCDRQLAGVNANQSDDDYKIPHISEMSLTDKLAYIHTLNWTLKSNLETYLTAENDCFEEIFKGLMFRCVQNGIKIDLQTITKESEATLVAQINKETTLDNAFWRIAELIRKNMLLECQILAISNHVNDHH